MGNGKKETKQLLQTKALNALSLDILTTGQVAALFGVNFKTVLRWASSGKILANRLPGQRGGYRYTKTAVLEFAKYHNLPLLIPEKNKKALVLVVDDDPMISKSIARVLHGICYVISATDGYQAGVLMALRKPTLVFLDLQMPGVDGFSLLTYMHSVPELRSIAVCVISGAEPEKLDQAVRAGAIHALSKPFSAESIRAVTAKIVHREQKWSAA